MSDLRGMVQIYTGDGKGKTTAALGLALRAVGRGLRVKIYQFMKPPQSTGEHFSATRLEDSLTIVPVGLPKWIRDKPDPEDVGRAETGLAQARQDMLSGRLDLLILDEAITAIYFNILQLNQVLDLLDHRPPRVEVVLTGRNAPQALLDRADLVTEMKMVKHPYNEGEAAREGIEY